MINSVLTNKVNYLVKARLRNNLNLTVLGALATTAKTTGLPLSLLAKAYYGETGASIDI